VGARKGAGLSRLPTAEARRESNYSEQDYFGKQGATTRRPVFKAENGLPVHPPRWASNIVERDGELLGVHAVTGSVYDLRPGDLSPQDWETLRAHAAARGATREELARLVAKPGPPQPISGPSQECVVCGGPSEPSAGGTATCSTECTGQLADDFLPAVADELIAIGREPKTTKPSPNPRGRRPPPTKEGRASVKRARERLGSCGDVLERHGHRVRGRMARCPLHDDRTPSLSLFMGEDGESCWFCHACTRGGDVIDLESALSGQALGDLIRWWGR